MQPVLLHCYNSVNELYIQYLTVSEECSAFYVVTILWMFIIFWYVRCWS